MSPGRGGHRRVLTSPRGPLSTGAMEDRGVLAPERTGIHNKFHRFSGKCSLPQDVKKQVQVFSIELYMFVGSACCHGRVFRYSQLVGPMGCWKVYVCLSQHVK